MGLSDDVSDMAGCFLDKGDLAMHWIHENLTNNKSGRNAQSFYTIPHYKVEYPILCYDGPFPDRREITLLNLADKTSARNSL